MFLAGSGVSGIVHKAAGHELEVIAMTLGAIAPGKSVITPDHMAPLAWRYAHLS